MSKKITEILDSVSQAWLIIRCSKKLKSKPWKIDDSWVEKANAHEGAFKKVMQGIKDQSTKENVDKEINAFIAKQD